MQPNPEHPGESRRSFLKKATATTAVLAGADVVTFAANHPAGDTGYNGKTPWFRRVTRWGQTNITEMDPQRYDIGWWRKHWRRTETQGVVVNAGGIVAYYPSRVPFHRQARYLGGARSLRRVVPRRARGGPGRVRPHGFQPRRRGALPGAPGLVCD
jgi:hypothetical protein